jgi:hypothetical protein
MTRGTKRRVPSVGRPIGKVREEGGIFGRALTIDSSYSDDARAVVFRGDCLKLLRSVRRETLQLPFALRTKEQA